jgi:uncharacterized protein (TIGR03067 family)
MNASSKMAIVLLGILLTGAWADASVLILKSPSIDFEPGVERKLADGIRSVVEDKRFQFLGGGRTTGWGPEHDSTTLLHSGDTKRLAEFLIALDHIEGLGVTIRFLQGISQALIPEPPENLVIGDGIEIVPRARPVPSWEVDYYKQRPDRIEVRINQTAKDISVPCLVEELARQAAKVEDSDRGRPSENDREKRGGVAKDKGGETHLHEEIKGEGIQQTRMVLGQKMDDQAEVRLVVSDRELKLSQVFPLSKRVVTISREYYRLNLKKNPAQIDTTGATDWTEMDKGICKIEEERLTLCLAAKGAARPTKFATGEEPGIGKVLFVFKRVRRVEDKDQKNDTPAKEEERGQDNPQKRDLP